MKLRTSISLLSLVVLTLIVVSCGQQSKEGGARDWAEMDAYHMLMAEAFHPYMDSSNLEPAKKLAPQLLEDAKTWESSKLPAKVDNATTKETLKRLTSFAEQLNKDVQAANNDAIAVSLDSLHNVFHELQNQWYAASGHEHSDHHDHEHGHEHEGHERHEH